MASGRAKDIRQVSFGREAWWWNLHVDDHFRDCDAWYASFNGHRQSSTVPNLKHTESAKLKNWVAVKELI